MRPPRNGVSFAAAVAAVGQHGRQDPLAMRVTKDVGDIKGSDKVLCILVSTDTGLKSLNQLVKLIQQTNPTS